MKPLPSDVRTADPGDSACHLDAEMAELTLLLPAWWLGALEEEAERHGWTAAQLVRHLIRDYLTR